ncbi:MAG: hypothetical protein QOJ79_151 [Actinomycetota bacterium]|jgi:hypothetical protein|nr:hypothetical protein [Actinomycetota bacterium]
MTRTRWTGLTGLLFGVLFFAIDIFGPSTPNTNDAHAVTQFASYWGENSSQTKSRIATLLVTYTCIVLIAFAAGLRDRLRAADPGPLPSFVLAAGTAAAVLVSVGAVAGFATGIAASDIPSFKVDGGISVVLDDMGYMLLATGLMAAGGMAVATSIVSRRTGVLPAWTAWLGFLLGLTAVGSIFTAWLGFVGLPIWVVAVSVALLMRKDTAEVAAPTA